MLTYQNVYITQKHSMWKFGEDKTLPTLMAVDNFLRNATKSRFQIHQNLRIDWTHILWKFGEAKC